MSLVNDMLRDLDQRRDKPEPARAIPLTASAAAQPAAKTRWGLLAGAGAVTAALAGWLVLSPADAPPVAKVPAPKPAPTAPVSPTLPEVATAPVAAPEVTPSAPVLTLSRVQWQADGEDWLLLLDSNRPLPYSLERIDQRELRLQLSDLRFDGALPPLPAELIQALSIQPREHSSELRLRSRRPADFQVEALSSDQPHRLQIRVIAQAAPLNPATVQAGAPPPPVPAVPPTQATESTTAPKTAAKAAPVSAESTALPVTPLRKKARPSLAQRDQQSVTQALALVRKGRSGEAMAELQARVSTDPAALESRTLLATLLLADGRNDVAAPVIDGGLASAAQHHGLRKLKARLLIGTGRAGAAAELLAAQPPVVAEDPEFHQLKGAAEQAADRHDAASRTYHALLQTDATNPAWWVGLGISLEALQQRDQARQAYTNVLRIPQAPAALSRYARGRLQQLGG